MTDTDLGNTFYNITVNDQTSGGLNSASINFAAMFYDATSGLQTLQTLFDDTIGKAFTFQEELQHIAEGTGMTDEQTEKWNQANVAVGASMTAMGQNIEYVQGKLADNTSAGDTYRATLDSLNVTYKDANGNFVDADTLQKNILSTLSEIPAGTERASAAYEIYGRGWKTNAELYNNAGAALNAYNDQAALTNDQMQDLHETTVATGVAQQSLTDLWGQIATGNLGALFNPSGSALTIAQQQEEWQGSIYNPAQNASPAATTAAIGATPQTSKQQEEAQKKAEKTNEENQKKAEALDTTQTKLAQTIEDNSQRLGILQGETPKTATAQENLQLEIRMLKEKIDDEINTYKTNSATLLSYGASPSPSITITGGINITVTPPAGSSPTEVGTAVGSAINDQLADTANLRTQRIAMGIGGND